MNRSFRLVRNEQTGALVAVSENARGRGKRSVRRLTVLGGFLAAGLQSLALAAPPVNQLPTGGQIVAGAGSISQSANALTVRQSSDKLVANWNSFNIGQNASVQFVQPSSTSVALNRIADTSPSQIFGKLSANGQVFLLNPQGIVFGATARVDVGALVASSLDLSTANFLAGNYQFAKNASAGGVSNFGQITANGGAGSVVAFMAPQVSNTGSISATGGNVALAAGDKVSLDFAGTGLIKLQVDQGAFKALVDNKGLIQADGGAVIMTAKTASDLMATVVNNEGTVQARTLQNKEGRILLLGDMAHGETRVAGTLDASAPDGGNGGFIETSAAKVKFVNSPNITTHAPLGKSGTWLIDPNDFTIAAVGGDITGADLAAALALGSVTIETGNTQINPANPVVCTAVAITCLSGVPGNGDIFVNDNILTTGLSATTLTLQAERDIVFGPGGTINWDSLISAVPVTASPISVVLQSNYTDAPGGGAIVMLPGSAIYSKGGSITLTGGSIGSASAGYAVGRSGALDLSGGGGADSGNGISIIGATLNSAGGNIVLRGKSVTGANLVNSAGISTADGVFISDADVPDGLGGFVNVPTLIDSGAGTINITGLVTGDITAADGGHGVGISANSTLKSSKLSANAISITGDASGLNSTTVVNDGVSSSGVIEANADGGGIAISGTTHLSNPPEAPFFSVYLDGYTHSNNGAILVNGTGGYGISLSPLSVTGDVSVSVSAKANSVSLISDIGITQGGPIDATGTVSLDAGANGISQFTDGVTHGVVRAGSLLVTSTGGVSLNGQLTDGVSASANAVGTFAANVSSPLGLMFLNSGDLTIGSVLGTDGVTMSGQGFVGIATTGDLTIAQDVWTAYNGINHNNTALALVAGNVYGTPQAAGNILISGTPIVTISGGNAGLFSSTVAGSTGLTALVGSGSGNFRYNTTIEFGLNSGTSPNILPYTLTSGFTAPLFTGVYAVYGEQPAVTITADNVSSPYGVSPVFTTSGTLNGDLAGPPSVAGSVSTSGNYIVGPHTLTPATAALVSLGYAAPTVVTGTLTITPASISAITGITAANRTYDGTPAATLNTATPGFTGMVAGDALTVASSSGAFVDKNVGFGKTVNITGLSLGGADVANYTLASTTASASADITEANLTVSTNAVSKTYDGTTSAAGSLVVIAGTLFTGDSLSGGTFTFDNKNVGAGNKIVTVSGVTLNDGNLGSNYILNFANNTTSTINPFAVNLTGTKTYDGLKSVASTALTIGALPNGENLTISGTGSTVDKNVGIAKGLTLGTLALADGTTGLASNYTLMGGTLTVDVTPAPLTVSGATAVSRPYDGTTVANVTGAVLSGTVFAADQVSLVNATTGNFADATAGTAKLVTMTASLTGADAVNYSLTQPTGLTADITAVVTTPSAAVAAVVQKTVTVVNSPVIAMPTQQTALITYFGVAPAPLPAAALTPVAATTPAPANPAEVPTSTTAKATETPAQATPAPTAAPTAPETKVATTPAAEPVKPAAQPTAATKTVAAKAATASPKAAAPKQIASKTATPVGRAVAAPSVPNTGFASRLAAVPPGLGLRPPMVHLPVPPAIKNFAAAVPDVVGQKYPLLAESKIVPKEPEHDIRSVREDEMAQSFDSLPSPHNPGRVTKGNQSKASIIYEETLELVNFLNLMTLKIVP